MVIRFGNITIKRSTTISTDSKMEILWSLSGLSYQKIYIGTFAEGISNFARNYRDFLVMI